ncbi:MgtC/SapB family protein [Dactylosporangium sp. AC04546]|uniref:MgtC/SapB family protein n=1 Tax=Dactylosporangium sp. AC04546 TaxID=2862460 RepID=UPI001EE103E3|nr:MgtC/SapB family protein [Dactylosporangium sp. AC04546]WVK88125.1 MgtC/SapB family protein [Dactylosporangium sp. AC04546]
MTVRYAVAMEWTVIPPLLVAILLGAVLGLERELGAQPAGLRTHMLVAAGASLFTIAGYEVGTDPTRIAAQVVTGIGFLGAGAILREGVTISGLTTAASLWVTAAIGLVAGLQLYWAAAAATAVALAALWLFKFAEAHWLPDRHRIRVTLTLAPGFPLDVAEREASGALTAAAVLRIDYARQDQQLVLMARADDFTSLPAVAERLRRLDGVQGVEIVR